MHWIIQGLCEVFLSLFKEAFAFLSANFLGNIGINIGAKFPNIDSPNISLMEVFKSIGEGNGLFDEIFSGTKAFSEVFVITGITLVFVIGIIELYRAMFAPLDDVEHPINIAVKMITTSGIVAFSYQIMVIFEYIAQKLYIMFQKVAFSKAVLNANVSYSTGGESQDITHNLQSLTLKAFDQDALSVMLGQMGISDAASGVGAIGGNAIIDTLTSCICLICLFLIIWQYFRLLLEMVERYAVMGLLFYSAPVAFATLTSKKTGQIFRSWTGMVVSQFILLITNCFFLNTFIGAVAHFGALNFVKTTFASYLVYMLLLIAWLKVGQRADQYLKGLGLSTAQCGGALSSVVGGTVGGLLAGAGTHVARRGVSKGIDAIGTAKANKAAARIASETADTRNKNYKQSGGGGAMAVNDMAKDGVKGFDNPANRAQAEKMIKDTRATGVGADIHTSLDTNDGGKVKIGKGLGDAGQNGVIDIGNGMQAQIEKASPQAFALASIGADGDSAARSLAQKTENAFTNGSGLQDSGSGGDKSYSLSGAHGPAYVVSGEEGRVATASCVNEISPVYDKLGIGFHDGNAIGVTCQHMPVDMEGGIGRLDMGNNSFYEDVNGAGVFSHLNEDGEMNYLVGAGDISKEGLDILNEIDEGDGWKPATITGQGYIQEPEIAHVYENDFDATRLSAEFGTKSESLKAVSLNERTYRTLYNKGYIRKLNDADFANAAFSHPKAAIDPLRQR